MNQIITLYVEYVNSNMVVEKGKKGDINTDKKITYDQLASNIEKISGSDYSRDIKIRRFE